MISKREWLRKLNARTEFLHGFPDRHPVVLKYHSVGGTGWGNIPSDWFRSHLDWLLSRYEIVDLPAVINPDREKLVALTFDDGLASFHRTVLPILRAYDVPATVFLIGNAVRNPEGDHMPVQAEYMSRKQVRRLVDEPLVTVGNYTRTHPRLPELDRNEIESEIVGGKQLLETELEVEIDRFCYPFNGYDARSVAIARRHHDVAVTTGNETSLITAETDPHRIPRTRGEQSLDALRWMVPDASTILTGGYHRYVR